MNINAEKLAQEIDNEFKTMRFHPAVEESRFAIFERNGIQVQVLLTKNEDDFHDDVISDIVIV